MRVYRMEHRSGAGAFDHLPWGLMGLAADYTTELHPTPYEDDELQSHERFRSLEARPSTRFGCLDVDTLREWFPPKWLPAFEDHEVDFTVWEVPDEKVAWSGRQAIFDVTCADCLERLPPSALHQPDRQLALPLAA